MNSPAILSRRDGVGLILIDSPPVNALSHAVRMAIVDGLQRLLADPSVQAIVLACSGRTFFAGADITEFNGRMAEPDLRAVCAQLDSSSKPLVAAIHGTALGGGLEAALVCHFRIAVTTAKLGLPEVQLGLLPGAGGTQRLPRIVGVEQALDMMIGGRPVGARRALELGLIDALADEGRLVEDAIAFARGVVNEGRPLRRVRDRDDLLEAVRGKPEVFTAIRKAHARASRGFRAPESIIRAVEAAVSLPFDAGMEREHELFVELLASTESAAQRHAFFAERETARIPGMGADTPTLPVRAVGVVGAGTMGGGITMNFLNASIPVTIVDATQAALDRGVAVIRRNYEATASKGRMTQTEIEQRMALLTPTLDLAGLAQADLVIEAIFESMAVKRDMFARLDAIAKPGAILASNTSFLDLNEIASATARPESVVGMHFFSPANVMRLLEVVRGARTARSVLATAMGLGRRLGKVAVMAGNCQGFIANRAMHPRWLQAEAMTLEGTKPTDIDRAIYDYGFAMGPFQMADLIGLDVLGRDSAERTVMGDLVARGRLGQKSGGGYYDYDAERRQTPSPIAAEVIAAVAQAKGVRQTPVNHPGEILARLLYPVVNEGARILEEGIALRASDIDMAAILGYNWPAYTGGPMFWAGTVGLPKILSKLQELQAIHGNAFRPALLLEKLAREGGHFS